MNYTDDFDPDAPPLRAKAIQSLLDAWAIAMLNAPDEARQLQAIATTRQLLAPHGDAALEPTDYMTENALYIYNLDAGQVQAAMAEGVRRAEAKAKKTNGGGQASTKPSSDRIRLTFFDALTRPTPKPYLIKGVMARGETSSWIAPPGKGKSALLTDTAVHLAEAPEWRGHRIKKNVGTTIFALERADLTRRRLLAHKFRDGLPDKLPIAVAGQVINLMHQSCVGIILDALKRAADHCGVEMALAIFDTYSKGIAAGGGDESSARDQNIVIANLRRVIDQTNIHIACVGHTGKDESRGERGSNAHLADVDLEVRITGDSVKTATVTKANDQPEGVLTGFRMEPYEFAADPDDGEDEPFQTFIVSREVLAGRVASDRKLSDRQRLAIDALVEVSLSRGRLPPAGLGLPGGIKVVTADEWKAELYRQGVLDQDAHNPRARFAELRMGLKGRRLIGAVDDFVWLPTIQGDQI